MGWRTSLLALKRRVKDFASKYNGKCSVVLIVVEGTCCSFCGSAVLCQSGKFRSAVCAACKTAVNEEVDIVEVGEDYSKVNLRSELSDVLKSHVLDMDVSVMRSVVSKASAPSDSISNRDARKNWYQAKNCPVWWLRTGLRFESVNHPKSGQRLKQQELWQLVNSLQQFLGVKVNDPSKACLSDLQLATYPEDTEQSEETGEELLVVNDECDEFLIEEMVNCEEPGGINVDVENLDVNFVQGNSRDEGEIEMDEEQQLGQRQLEEDRVPVMLSAIADLVQTERSEVEECGEVEEPATVPKELDAYQDADQHQLSNIFTMLHTPVQLLQQLGQRQLEEDRVPVMLSAIADLVQTERSEVEECGEVEESATVPKELDAYQDADQHQLSNIFTMLHTPVQLLQHKDNDSIAACSIMGTLSKLHWSELQSVSGQLLVQLPILPSEVCQEFCGPKIGSSFREFLPTKMMTVAVPRDGNCLFSSLSVHLFGGAQWGMLVKLHFCLRAVTELPKFVEQVQEHYGKSATIWSAQSLSKVDSTSTLLESCQLELMDTLAFPYKDSGMFHVQMVPFVFRRPLQQFCLLDSDVYKPYQCPIFPPTILHIPPFTLVWIPTTCEPNAPITHVIPARPIKVGPLSCTFDECGATAIGRCIESVDVRQSSLSSSTPVSWVQCSCCRQWFHCTCVGLAQNEVPKGEWRCGCRLLVNDKVEVDVSWCSNVPEILKVVDEIDVQAIFDRPLPWFRTTKGRDLFMTHPKDHHGPFSEDAWTAVEAIVAKKIGRCRRAKQTHLVSETCIEVLKRRCLINRLTAEVIMLGLFATGDKGCVASAPVTLGLVQ